MKEYVIVYKMKGLPFHERTKVYAENRTKAVQTLKEHFGKGAVEIVHAMTAERYYKYDW